eukprot:1983523-Pyramimonas_sp.AAC.1
MSAYHELRIRCVQSSIYGGVESRARYEGKSIRPVIEGGEPPQALLRQLPAHTFVLQGQLLRTSTFTKAYAAVGRVACPALPDRPDEGLPHGVQK